MQVIVTIYRQKSKKEFQVPHLCCGQSVGPLAAMLDPGHETEKQKEFCKKVAFFIGFNKLKKAGFAHSASLPAIF